jgi:tripartite-type tricarboxylate transporter receptor subunit TctC
MLRFIRTALICGLWLASSLASMAADYPDRPIRIIVGPGLDTPARLFGAKIGELLHTTVVVEQKPGAGGAIALQFVASAPPDGYTLLLATAAYTINTAIGRFSLDLRKDFVPIGQVTEVKYVLAVTPSLPVHSVPELIAYAKEHPGRVNFGSVGIGTPPHLAAELFKSKTGINITHVPFREPASAMTGLIRGDVQMMFALAQTAEPQMKAGTIRGLALSSRTPSPFVPELKTIEQLGVHDFNVVGWNGLVAPKGTPAPIIKKLNDAIRTGLQDQALRAQVLKSGYEPTSVNSPEQFGAFIAADTEKWSTLAQKIGLHVSP